MVKSVSTKQSPLLVVGIGTSAGGLKALKQLFAALPKDLRCAYLVVQHLDPTHKSMLPDLLAGSSNIEVVECGKKEILEPDKAYIIPPGVYIEAENGIVQVCEPNKPRGFRMPVDHLFYSLADSYGNKAVGVVLTGTGTDGTAGLRAIRAASGLAIVQDPDSAEYPGMPHSAVKAGVADRIVELADIPAIIQAYISPSEAEAEESNDKLYEQLQVLSALLKAREKFNIGVYKDSTVQRRIFRRMSLIGKQPLSEYIEFVREDENERRLLAQDILINVTDFFRDSAAYDALSKGAITSIVDQVEDGGEIRLWVAGCASGEEAYSITILMLEKLAVSGKEVDLRVFATDADSEAIAMARKGEYPTSLMAHIPSNFVNRYFVRVDDNNFQVANFLRDKLSFAEHNVVTDPPFGKMDLISCRNLLIYLKRDIQESVLGAFHFALKPGGYLFLGSSESIDKQSDLFHEISKKWRIYKRQDGVGAVTQMRPGRFPGKNLIPEIRRSIKRGFGRGRDYSGINQLQGALLQYVTPPSVLIGNNDQILFVHGDINEFIRVPPGEPTLDFVQLLEQRLRTRLRSGVFKARRNGEKVVVYAPQSFSEGKNNNHQIKVSLTPLVDDEVEEGAVVIAFEKVATGKDGGFSQGYDVSSADQEKIIESLERELTETRDELQSTVEELESSSEELKTSHEEALSTNEELQSANEELEASTEELRSLNEELTTVNTELKEKIAELLTINTDLQNFFSSTNLATIFLDGELRIKRFTPAAARLLNIGTHDLDHPLAGVHSTLIDESLNADAYKVLDTMEPQEVEQRTDTGVWLRRKILPYRAENRRVGGVVVTWTNISSLKEAVMALEVREMEQAIVAKLGLEALRGGDIKLLMRRLTREIIYTLNADYCEILEYRSDSKDFLLLAEIGFSNAEEGKTVVSADINSQAGYTLQESRPVIVEDTNSDKRFNGSAVLFERNVTSGMSCVIPGGDSPYGILGVHTREQRFFSEDDTNFLTSMANLLSVALHRKEAEQYIAVSEERLNMACEAANIGIHDHDLITNTVRWDKKIYDIWGIDQELQSITYEIFEEGLHPDDRARVRAEIEASAAKGEKAEDLRIEYRVRNKKNSKVCWIEATGRTFYKDGNPARMVGTVQDITQRKQTELSLFQSEQKLRIATNSNRLGAFIYDIKTGMLEWDQILLDVWGVKENEKTTLDMFFEGLHPDDREPTRTAIEMSTDPKGDRHYHCTYRVINRQTKALTWIEASGQVRFENDEAVDMVGMVIDVTDKKSLEQSLQQAVRKLGEENIRKNEFIATLGHELRNPLAAVNSGIQLMQLGTGDPKWTLEMMANNMELTCSLLDDLLDLTRVSLGKISLKKESLDLREILIRSRDIYTNLASEKKQIVNYDIANTPIYVNGDPVRLEQVFGNILTNAQKFTPENGEIYVTAAIDRGNAVIKVSDNGIGISEEELPNVFMPFHQLPSNSSNTGLGIGLSLVREFIELHGGKVEVTSPGLGGGSTFIVTLPLQKSATVARPATPKEREIKPQKGLRILLVDDNKDAAQGLEAMLESYDYQVKTAFTGNEALTELKNFTPDAFILDIRLPDMTGFELLAKIKQQRKDDALYIALSGYGPSHRGEIDEKYKFDIHLTKPAQFKDILSTLSKVVKQD